MILIFFDKVDSDLYNHIRKINDAELHLDNYYSNKEVYKMITWIKIQGQRHVYLLNNSDGDPTHDHYK